MPNTSDNLEKEIEAGLAQAEKMLRVEKNMKAISEINIDELPEMARPVYISLQENIIDENWEEIDRLAQALKLLAPNFTVTNQIITNARNEIKQKEEETKKQEELARQAKRDKLLQEQNAISAQLAELDGQENKNMLSNQESVKEQRVASIETSSNNNLELEVEQEDKTIMGIERSHFIGVAITGAIIILIILFPFLRIG
jgi:hypothetical protein